MITVKFTAAEESGKIFRTALDEPLLATIPLRICVPVELVSDRMQARIEEAVEKMIRELNQD